MEHYIPIFTLFIVLLYGFYIYAKILNQKPYYIDISKIIISVILSGLLAILIFSLRDYLPRVRFAIMIGIFAAYAGIVTKSKPILSLMATLLSVGSSYALSFICSFILAFLLYITIGNESRIVISIMSALMQGIFVFFFFKIKRFRNGIPFLHKKAVSSVGLLISLVILIIMIMLSRETTVDVGIWLLIGLVVCVVGLYLWYRRGITWQYRGWVKEKNAQEYERVIAEKDDQIQKIKADNDMMASVIHRDNKLLPAMYKAVELSLDPCTSAQSNGKRLLQQISLLMDERADVIKQSLEEQKTIPTTNILLVDGILQYMRLKASTEDIQFDVVTDGDWSDLYDNMLSELDIETLCADLIENAIKAVKCNKHKQIAVTFNASDDLREILVQDSGKPFEIGTLLNLGKKKSSTYLSSDGSGIGYMTIFEILEKCNASLIITEYESCQNSFTKSVCVRFNNKGEYIIKTYRHATIEEQRKNTSSSDNRLIIKHL